MRVIVVNTNPKAQLGLPSVNMLGQMGSAAKSQGELVYELFTQACAKTGSPFIPWRERSDPGLATWEEFATMVTINGSITNKPSMLEAILDLDKAEQQKIYKLLWANGCRI